MPVIDRRSFLRLGLGGGIGIVAWPGSLTAVQEEPRKVKSVVWLWMDGGMSQTHTWDPKPNAKVVCPIKAIDTAVTGIQVSELLPVCASQMKELSIIRSVSHGLGDHENATWSMHTGVSGRLRDDYPVIGTILAHELGRKESALPLFLVLDGPDLPESAVLGEEVLPFRLNTAANPIPNIRTNVGKDRGLERAALLLAQNKDWGSQHQQREVAKVEYAYVKSEELLNTPLLKAFNYHEEPAELRAQYGVGFGERCLLARRLVQSGCAFVEIGLGGWGISPSWGVPYKLLVPALDKGLGTLIKDLADKRLLKDTVVVCATEFGKTPQLGTDPWPRGFSVVLAGGSLQGGRVYGDTGPQGTDCASPVLPKELFATIYKACGVDRETPYLKDFRNYKFVADGKPVDDLF